MHARETRLGGERSRFDVVIGDVEDDRICSLSKVGTAIQSTEGHFLDVKLNLFPRTTFYIKRNFQNPSQYTLYSQLVHTESGPRLLRPVGVGTVHSAVRTLIEIRVPLLPRSIFLSSLALS